MERLNERLWAGQSQGATRTLRDRSTGKVTAELAADLSRIKGRLHEEVLTEVIAAVKRAPTLSPTEQTRIADALTRQAAGEN